MASLTADRSLGPRETLLTLSGVLASPADAKLILASLASCRARTGDPAFTEADALAAICRYYLERHPYDPFFTR